LILNGGCDIPLSFGNVWGGGPEKTINFCENVRVKGEVWIRQTKNKINQRFKLGKKGVGTWGTFGGGQAGTKDPERCSKKIRKTELARGGNWNPPQTQRAFQKEKGVHAQLKRRNQRRGEKEGTRVNQESNEICWGEAAKKRQMRVLL